MVELIYAPKDRPIIHLHLPVSEGATVGDVLTQSGLMAIYPEICGLSVGIFGKQVELTTKVEDGSRIEIYRPLLIDPMEKRRRRART
jgi:putative ubiquitin-RnfH superfamily antitoxin RatB of RatAB toxin-antitoxin module